MAISDSDIKQLEAEEEYQQIREQILLLRNEYGISSVGNLLDILIQSTNSNTEAVSKSEHYDKEVAGILKMVAEYLKKISEREDKVMDIKPLINIVNNYLNQNKSILETVSKQQPIQQDTNANRDLVNGIIAMMQRQNDLLSQMVESQNRMFEKITESHGEFLEKVTDQINQIQKPKEIESFSVIYANGRVEKTIPNYKK